MTKFMALVESHNDWYVGFCQEVPEASGQGKTAEDCHHNLADAVSSVLPDRYEDALRTVLTS